MGKLYLVGTPIGNLGDMTYRAVETLKQADFICAEDTRVTAKLLNYFDINKPLVSYHEHNAKAAGRQVVDRILSGESCAIVTDAGMPCISDPGEDLVKLCYQNGIEVNVVPGPSAVVSALAVSGLDTSRFTFEGFLSVTKKQRFSHLAQVKDCTSTMIFYEAPHKLIYTLKDMLEYFGDRKISLCRELTKIHEEVIHTTLKDAQSLYDEQSPKGEFVVVIEGAKEVISENFWDNLTISEHIESYLKSGEDIKEAIKKVAKDRGLPKREVYNEYHGIGDTNE
ncbi:MAG: 16S rRNA (cytidine(1402)-2'-O)-methyltransferase [Lachnospiraceae bacterium]|nr:16S rRNA (cytidine(1402)-2'-O)-methyltransferase [Lachnospiraceae bacterium]